MCHYMSLSWLSTMMSLEVNLDSLALCRNKIDDELLELLSSLRYIQLRLKKPNMMGPWLNLASLKLLLIVAISA